MQTNSIDFSDLYSVDDYAALYPRLLSRHTLRYQLRNRDANGLSGACVRIGKKLLISNTRYQAWVARQAESGFQEVRA